MLAYLFRLRRFQTANPALMVALAVVTSSVFIAAPIHAQLVNGYISGTLTDQMNASIPNVDVTLTNRGTGNSRTIKTDERGFYRFVAVNPGSYDISFKKTGFQPQTIEDFGVTSSDERTFNQTLDLASLSTAFDVHEVAGVSISRTSGTVAMSLSGLLLDHTPMSTSSTVPAGARNYGRYVLFAPTVARVPGQNEAATNGHPGRDTNFMVDGGDNNDNTVTLPALLPPPEAIQEFQVQVTTFSAEFGRNIGAQINAVTMSGTKKFHGEMWEFYRGSAFEPYSLQSRRAGLKETPRLVDNQFGFSIGGPVIKNKTFFFGLLQANRQRQAPKPAGAVSIPTAAGFATLTSVPLRLASGSIGAQSAASRQAMLDELSFLQSVYPKIQRYDSFSTIPVNGTDVEFGTYNPLVPQNQNLWYGVAKVDHQATPNDRISYRVHTDNRDSPLSGGNLAFGELFGVDSQTHIQNHALNYTKIVGQSLVNEARFTYARLDPSFVERDPVSATVNISGLFTIGGSASFPQQRLEQTYQFQNISTFFRNRHSLKFGLDLAWTHLFNNTAPNSKGTWAFSNFPDFMNNQANQLMQLVSGPSVFSFTQLKQAYFFQDDFKVSRSFTVNFGLRYETTSVPLGYFGATDPVVLASTVPGPGKRDTNNLAPRVGFAYSPYASGGLLGKILGNGKSSIRGGFGMGYDVLFYNLLIFPAANYPRTNTQTTLAANLIDTFPTQAPKTSVATFNPLATYANLTSNAQNPTSNYWSLSFQRQLASNSILEAGYTGNVSYHLIRQSQANPGILTQAKADAVIAGCTSANLASCQDPGGFPTSPGRVDTTIGNRTLLETTGRGSYNAGYIQWTNRTSFGLQYGANYTVSSTITDSEEALNDIGSSDGGIAGSSPQVPQNYLNRRAEKAKSVFDRPQRFTIHETYMIPFFSNTSKFLQLVFSRWQISSITEIQSGQPFTITVGVDTLGSGTITPGRPDLNPGGMLILDQTTGNLRTFTTALDGTGMVSAPHVTDSTGKITFLKNSMPIGGTLGRNSLRGPGYSNTNLSLLKNFKLPKEVSLEIRGDFLNLFNHDNFPNPDGNMSKITFGKQIYVPLTDARQVLLGAKIRF